uniref:Peptidase A1 domain-containing protein n=1 Tax=Parastrongyloides trichosuri TaxID=131310 RepID=A0A0N4ZZY8_PARTI
MGQNVKSYIITISLIINSPSIYGNKRHRGLGLLMLPTGATDERSGPYLPDLRIAGSKISNKPQVVPDVRLPGQTSFFTGNSHFNPFIQTLSMGIIGDRSDSWGFGYALSGVNNYNLNVKDNFDQFSDLNLKRNDGSYQPFINSFVVGSEYDLAKIRDISMHVDIPIIGVNEMFDFDEYFGMKTNGGSYVKYNVGFPLTLGDPSERFINGMNYMNKKDDPGIQYGHVLPGANLFLIDKENIMRRIERNKLNPTFIG